MMNQTENILILELFLCEQNDFFIRQELARTQPEVANRGNRRSRNQQDKTKLEFLKYDPLNEKKPAQIKSFTDFFKPCKT